MRQTKLFYKAKKTVPKNIEARSQQLLYRGDFIDQLGSGLYSFLPLGWSVMSNIAKIIREEMKAIGGQEVFLPSLHPKKVWQVTKRWETIRPPLFKLRDSHNKEFALGPTHEEVITQLVASRVLSYKDLPVSLFQIQNKFRNEIRYTGGLLRTREFLMKDLYSFHADQKDFEKYYQKVAKAYFSIFKRCGLEAKMVEASGEGFTNSFTHEFQVFTPVGEDTIFYCPKCGFARNKEIADYKAGDKCPKCGAKLELKRGIEIGNIFPLGDKYSKAFNLFYKDKEGNQKSVIMGCYGIGLGRLMASVVELNNDEKGIVWPSELAPFDIHLIPIEMKNKQVQETAEKIYQIGQKAGFGVLYDDRIGKKIGEKFVEADLIGIPIRIVVSKKTLEKNELEIAKRNKNKKEFLSIEKLQNFLIQEKKK